MTRYCLYCGRELQDGEICDCRQSKAQGGADKASFQNRTSANTANRSGEKQNDTGGRTYTGEPERRKRHKWFGGNAEARHAQNSGNAGYSHTHQTVHNGYGNNHTRKNFGSTLQYLLRFIAAPHDMMLLWSAQKISWQHYATFLLSLLLGSLEFAMIGLWLFHFNAFPPMIAFGKLYLLSLPIVIVVFLVFAFTAYLLLRFPYRRQLRFVEVISASRFAHTILIAFLLFALPLHGVGGVYNLVLIFAGLAMSLWLHIDTLAHVTNLSDNEKYSLAFVSIFIFASFLSFALYFLTAINFLR